MSLDRITQTLIQKFESKVDGEHKVIYWEDPKKEYFEYVKSLQINGVKVYKK